MALWTWLLPNLEKLGARHGEKSAFNDIKDDNFNSIANPHDVDPFFLVPSTSETKIVSEQPLTTLSSVSEVSMKPITILDTIASDDVSEPLATTNLKFPYTTALSLTIAIGCSLLILNLLVFAAFYYHKESSNEQGMYHTRNSMETLDSNQTISPNVQMQVTSVYKPSSPSHCGTLKSSATYRSSLGTSCDDECNEEEEEEDWPPEYTICCQRSLQLPRQPHAHGSVQVIQQSPSTQQIPSPRTSAAPPSQVEAEPLLIPEPFNQQVSHSNQQVGSDANL